MPKIRVRLTDIRSIDIEIEAINEEDAFGTIQNLYLAGNLENLLNANVVEYRTEDGTEDTGKAFSMEEVVENMPRPKYLLDAEDWLAEFLENADGDEYERYQSLNTAERLRLLAERLDERGLDAETLDGLDDELWNDYYTIRNRLIQEEADKLLQELTRELH